MTFNSVTVVILLKYSTVCIQFNVVSLQDLIFYFVSVFKRNCTDRYIWKAKRHISLCIRTVWLASAVCLKKQRKQKKKKKYQCWIIRFIMHFPSINCTELHSSFGYCRCDLKIMIIISSRKHACIILTPLNPHFYIVKLGFTGVFIIFLISAQKHRLWVLVRTASPRRF